MNKTQQPPLAIPTEELAARLAGLDFEERIFELYEHFSEQDVLVTTSFGVNSAMLLHLVNRVRPAQKIHFINTHHHFPETLEYKAQLTELLGLQVVEVFPKPQIHVLTEKYRFWETHNEVCCFLNKVLPLEPYKAACQVWMSGAMSHQTATRSTLGVFFRENAPLKNLRFYPLFDAGEEDVRHYMVQNGLPSHPLEHSGYGSIGCTYCTLPSQGRHGRWSGKEVNECGLHKS
jgi:phosphoadenosine phosphosulfate reductase